MNFFKKFKVSTFLILSLFVGTFFISNTQVSFAEDVTASTTVFVESSPSCTYSAWGTCSNGTKTRTVTSGGASCTDTSSSDGCNVVGSCTYSDWSACSASCPTTTGTQTRTVTSGTSCTASTSQSCTNICSIEPCPANTHYDAGSNTCYPDQTDINTTGCAAGTSNGFGWCSSSLGGVVATNCSIPDGGSTCSTSVTWGVNGYGPLPSWGMIIEGGNQHGPFIWDGNGGTRSKDIPHGSTRFNLVYQYRKNVTDTYYRNDLLAYTYANASCANNNWNGASCGSNGCPVGQVLVNGVCTPPPSSNTLSGEDCKIPNGASTCNIKVSWNIGNPGSSTGGINGLSSGCDFSGNFGIGADCPRSPGTYNFQLQLGVTGLASMSKTASCDDGLSWRDGLCQADLDGTISVTPCNIPSGGSSCVVSVTASLNDCTGIQLPFIQGPPGTNNAATFPDQGCNANYPNVTISYGAGNDILNNSAFSRYSLFKSPGSIFVKGFNNAISCVNSTWDVATGRCLSSTKLQGSLTVSNIGSESCSVPSGSHACCTIPNGSKNCQVDLAYFVWDPDFPGGGSPYESSVGQELTNHKKINGVPWENLSYTNYGYITPLGVGRWQMLTSGDPKIRAGSYYLSTNSNSANGLPWNYFFLRGMSRVLSPFTVEYGTTKLSLSNSPDAATRNFTTIVRNIVANCGSTSAWDDASGTCKSSISYINATDCDIPRGASTCSSPSNVDWFVRNYVSGHSIVVKENNTTISTTTTDTGSTTRTLSGGSDSIVGGRDAKSYLYELFDNGTFITDKVAYAKCAAGDHWDNVSGTCVINGAGTVSVVFDKTQVVKGSSFKMTITKSGDVRRCAATSLPLYTKFNDTNFSFTSGVPIKFFPEETITYTLSCFTANGTVIPVTGSPQKVIVKPVIDIIEQ